MAGKVGEAFVEIVADYKAFATKAQKELNVLLTRLANKSDFSAMAEASGDAGEESAREYTQRFEREQNRSTTKTRRRRIAAGIGKDFSKAFSDSTEREVDNNRLRRLFRSVGKKASEGFGDMFGSLGRGAAGIGGLIGSLGSGIGAVFSFTSSIVSLAGTLSYFLVLLPLVGGAVFSLAGAFVSLSGIALLLPAGLIALVTVLGVTQLAFSGFGEAISALADGDMKKFDQALKKLSPSARKVAEEVKGVWPQFDRLKKSVQESFFEPLVGSFDRFGNAVLPAITPKLSTIAEKLGAIAGVFIDKLSSPNGIKFFETVLDSVGRIVDRSGPGLERLFTAIANAVIASLPFAEKLFGAITDGLGQFGEFIDGKVADGSFQNFLNEALITGKDFVDVIKELLRLFGALFEDTEKGGQSFLKDISKALGKLTAFFESPDGKAALQAFIKLGGMAGSAMVIFASRVGQAYRAIRALKNAIVDAYHWVERFVDKWTKIGKGVFNAVKAGKFDIPFFADGGVITRPTLGMVGEAGPEVVVPLSNPKRARELMAQTGLVDLAGGMGGGGTTVVVYLGTEQITEILDQRVVKGLKQQGKRLAQGVRES